MTQHVLITADQLRRRVPGGIGAYVRGLADGLRGLDVDVTYWASRVKTGADDAVAALGPAVFSPLPAPLLTRAWDRGLVGPDPWFDVCHATSLAVPAKRRPPMSVFVHDLAWREVPEAFPPRGRRWHEAAVGRAIGRASLLLTPSMRTADALIAAGAPAARVEVVPEGCDHLPRADDAAADDVLAVLGVDGPFLLTVSTIEPRKNLARLIAAYADARPHLPAPWPLVVVGPRGWGEAGPAEGAAEGVVFAGTVDAPVLTSFYERARCVVYVPLVEGFGLPAVEAMHAGAPVVASPVPSTGEAALDVDPTDVGAIASGLLTAAVDGVARDALVASGRARAASLTWRACADLHVELWQTLS